MFRRKKKTGVRPRDGHVEHVCKKSGSISQKRHGHLAFCAQTLVRYVISFKLIGFGVRSSFLSRFCLMLNTGRSDLRFFARKNSTDMPWSTSSRFVQNAAQFFSSPPLGKSLNTTEEYEGLSLVNTSFAPRDSPRPRKKKSPCHPLTLFHWSWGSV